MTPPNAAEIVKTFLLEPDRYTLPDDNSVPREKFACKPLSSTDNCSSMIPISYTIINAAVLESNFRVFNYQ